MKTIVVTDLSERSATATDGNRGRLQDGYSPPCSAIQPLFTPHMRRLM